MLENLDFDERQETKFLSTERISKSMEISIESPAVVNRSTHVTFAKLASAVSVRGRADSAGQHCPALSVCGKQASRSYRLASCSSLDAIPAGKCDRSKRWLKTSTILDRDRECRVLLAFK